jgi:phage-related protein
MKKLFWIGSAKKDLISLPMLVQDTFGYASHLAQTGKKHKQTKALKGFGSAGVLEIVEDAGNATFRAVYTVGFENAVYVAFRKNQRKASRHRNRT